MSPALPHPSGKDVIRALERLGFEVVRVKGSHHFMRSADGRTAVVPLHHTIPPGTLASILRQSGISAQELIDALGGR